MCVSACSARERERGGGRRDSNSVCVLERDRETETKRDRERKKMRSSKIAINKFIIIYNSFYFPNTLPAERDTQ